MTKAKINALLSLIVSVVFNVHNGYAVVEGPNGGPWNVSLATEKHPYEKALHQAFPKGAFFFNLGPTGLRARIYPEKPSHLVVKFIFQDDKSPAAGKVEVEDVIVGANEKRFQKEYYFGREPTKSGEHGPLTELAELIEDSQGDDGKLHLILWPKGKEKDERIVTLQLKKTGRFSQTYPYNCPRSEKMLKQLCDAIAVSGVNGRPHEHGHSLLALMASGYPEYESIIKKEITKYTSSTEKKQLGSWSTWRNGYDGIILGEYYLLYKDESVIPIMKLKADAYNDAMLFGDSGRYSHHPYPIYAKEARRPYASMAAVAGLSMVSMSLFKTAGLYYHEPTYQAIHHRYLAAARPKGVGISYSFPEYKVPDEYDYKFVVVKVKDPKKGLSGKGPGYECPTGMKDLGAYTIAWPLKSDWDYKRNLSDSSWIENEKETNVVIEYGDGFRRIQRNHPKYKDYLPKEPTEPYPMATTQCGGAPIGLGALAHAIGNTADKSWSYLTDHCANTAALSAGVAFNAHASTHLSTFWTVLGAARAEPKLARAFLDEMKTFLIISETHYGEMIVQPWMRDRGGITSDCAYGPISLPTATAAILLSLGKKRLQITGAESFNPTILSPLSFIQKDGFLIKHFTAEADYIRSGKPYNVIFKRLQSEKDKSSEKGTEAAIFLERFTVWVHMKANELLEEAEKTPALSFMKMDNFSTLCRGIQVEELDKVDEKMKELKNIKYLGDLLAIYKKIDYMEEKRPHISSSSYDKSKGYIVAQLNKFIGKPEIFERIKEEAETLIEKYK